MPTDQPEAVAPGAEPQPRLDIHLDRASVRRPVLWYLLALLVVPLIVLMPEIVVDRRPLAALDLTERQVQLLAIPYAALQLWLLWPKLRMLELADPAMTINTGGIEFHKESETFYIPWSDIGRVRVTDDHLDIEMFSGRRKFWRAPVSLWHVFQTPTEIHDAILACKPGADGTSVTLHVRQNFQTRTLRKLRDAWRSSS